MCDGFNRSIRDEHKPPHTDVTRNTIWWGITAESELRNIDSHTYNCLCIHYPQLLWILYKYRASLGITWHLRLILKLMSQIIINQIKCLNVFQIIYKSKRSWKYKYVGQVKKVLSLLNLVVFSIQILQHVKNGSEIFFNLKWMTNLLRKKNIKWQYFGSLQIKSTKPSTIGLNRRES